MSKKRFSFSLLIALVMVLVFSVTTLAATGVVKLKAGIDKNGLLTATWSADTAAGVTGYTAVISKDGTVVNTQTVGTATVTFQTTDLKEVYSVEITTNGGVNDTAKSTISDVKYVYNNLLTSTDMDNNLGNANQTGKGVTDNEGTSNTEVIKSSGVKNDGSNGTQRTHGEYQNNTNSCASCHQTHTGASKSLLFKDGVYNTCTACHDGTLGFYNVFDASNAGTFGGTHDGNMSVHLADGTVQVKAAPGGNGAANSGTWVNEFNCASCHAPHGSYSDRLLHYNPNGMGIATKTDGGIGLKGNTVVNFLNIPAAAKGLLPIVVRGTGTELGIPGLTTQKAIVVMEIAYDAITKVYSWKTSTTPWLYGYVYGSPKNYYTRFFNIAEGSTNWNQKSADGTDYINIIDNHDDEEELVKLEYGKGYVVEVTAGVLDSVVSANIARAYTVDLDLVEIARFGDANGVPIFESNVNALTTGIDSLGGNMTGAGIKMSTYCAACHTDYLAHSGATSGTWNQAFRHSTDSDSYTCVRCHYSHGTDVTVMMDAHGDDLGKVATNNPTWTPDQVENYMLDQNPSSALKRYTNMSVCWGCHTDSKAEQLKNTSSYTGSPEDPHGLEAQPQIPGATSPIDTNNIFAPLP